MKLIDAKRLADAFIAELEPACQNIIVAGSVRRERHICNDLDIVLIPKYETVLDGMFDTKQVSMLDPELDRLVKDGRIVIEMSGPKLKRGRFPNKGNFPFDIYVGTPETWHVLLLIRTGSAEHNRWLCSRAIRMGMKLKADGSGIENQSGGLMTINSEAEVFDILGMEYLDPQRREWDEL